MWNYDGAVYIGGWNADIGNSGVKQGYGLEYVPGKYVYCGEFAKGQRHGNGILQMASTKLKKITEESCVMHEGGWFNN